MKGLRIYVASSWRNTYYPHVLHVLRNDGHDPYDFRQPTAGDNGFHWSEVDPDWKTEKDKRRTGQQIRNMLMNPIAQSGFRSDYNGMLGAKACVLVLPCGRSAHLEAGWFLGRNIPTLIYIPEPIEPELMYLLSNVTFQQGGLQGLSDRICVDLNEVSYKMREIAQSKLRGRSG